MQRRGRRVRTCGAWGTSAWWERASPPPDLNLGRPGFHVLFEECNGPPLRVEPRFPDRPFDDPQMAAPSVQLHLDGAGRRPRHASGRNERIVLGGDEQERDSHALHVIGFFFQAEDGIRDFHVTGVQTCALPIFGLVLPELNGKLDGFSIRVPTINVSVVDLSFVAARTTTVDEVNGILKAASESGSLKGDRKSVV